MNRPNASKSTLLALIAASCLVTGCGNQQPEPPYTLLTPEGRSELGISQLIIQCSPNNNGLSIYKKSDGILTPPDEKTSFFSNNEAYALKRAIESRLIINNGNNIEAKETKKLAQQLAYELNLFCEDTIKTQENIKNCGVAEKITTSDFPQRTVYRLSNVELAEQKNSKDAAYCNNWKKTALQLLEDTRNLAKDIRTENALTHAAAAQTTSWGLDK